MYAAYLSLTLHLYGLGSCICQRIVTWNEKWDDYRKKMNIPSDEQVVCVLCVGNLKEKCRVPISHRINSDEFCKFL